MKNIVVLGGAFFALGNVNPAAEANVSASFSYICDLYTKHHKSFSKLNRFSQCGFVAFGN